MPFQKAEQQAAYLKAGFYGSQGTGKTWTAVNLAIGLAQHIHSQKPIFFVDSETGSDFQIDRVRAAGLELMVDKTRAFTSLGEDIRLAEKEGDILIIDSVTHFWRELMQSYLAKSQYKFLTIRDFGPLKEEWATFSDLYVNSQLHIIICGRLSNVFEDIEDKRNTGTGGGKQYKTIKAGTKMSVESDMSYEPSLLVEMERRYLEDGGRYVRNAVVVKERFGVLDGKEFTDPTFKDFLPHIQKLNLGAHHVGFNATLNSQVLFQENDSEERKILLEEIQGAMVSLFPGSSGYEKKAKADLMQVIFETRSWSSVSRELALKKLQEGKTKLDYLGMKIALAKEEERALPEDFMKFLEDCWTDRTQEGTWDAVQ